MLVKRQDLGFRSQENGEQVIGKREGEKPEVRRQEPGKQGTGDSEQVIGDRERNGSQLSAVSSWLSPRSAQRGAEIAAAMSPSSKKANRR
jgi:hypothetical protein